MNSFDKKMRDDIIPKLWILIVSAKTNLQVSELIGRHAAQINAKRFGELWGYVQMNADRLYTQQIAMIFEEPKDHPLYSIPAIYREFQGEPDNEVFKNTELKKDFFENVEEIKRLLDDEAFKKFKRFRNKKIAHPELISPEAHEHFEYLPSIQKTEEILEAALRFLNVFSDAYSVAWDWPMLRAAPSVKRALIGLDIIKEREA
jgi:hypothetical protein